MTWQAERVLTLTGIKPKDATTHEIALAEKLARQYDYLRDAAHFLKIELGCKS